jgi:hypothetical protein
MQDIYFHVNYGKAQELIKWLIFKKIHLIKFQDYSPVKQYDNRFQTIKPICHDQTL